MEKIDIDIEIIWRKIHSSISKSEEQQLADWIGKHPENKKYYERVVAYHKQKHPPQTLSTEEAWKKINRQIVKTKPGKKAKRKWYYAAAVSLALATLATYFTLSPPRPDLPVRQQSRIVPGSSKATLIMADGRTVALEGNPLNLMDDSVSIASDGEQLVYSESNSREALYRKNTLVVPRGGKYALLLADGTQVVLNSETTLTYPVSFGRKNRRVQLKGEAFFDVREDPERPFEVITEDQVVSVLGTQFTISSYDEKNIATTLMEGSVKVDDAIADQTTYLVPGEQALFNKLTGGISKQVVDIESHMGWVEDLFVFDHQDLGEIMSTLARWYDVDVFFENTEVSKVRLTGEIERYENIGSVLKLIEKTEVVKFEIKNRTIIVK
ncbi:DUF4974 domain-containing protein [Fulvivirga sp. M361]|uniref:FecR family protein n=1 Tax=Fulvivirga sp. M361 TaxID=2594266 RepID=UPI00117A1D6F|nr:FecR family protein [Fulvivirga sp. M361]TRX48476.1 DUF4974 domain-containing protein [Fulvivirga sp. M361]